MRESESTQDATWLVPAALLAVVSLGFALGWREIFSPDLGFHLASARWIVEHRAWPATDPLTFTAAGRPYVDLQWLYQLGLYAQHALGGTAAIVACNVALTLATFALLAWRSVHRLGRLTAWCPALLLVFAMGQLWEVRPHVASWLFLNLVLLAGERRVWWAWPPLMALWVNTHSLFVVGLVSIAVHGASCWRERRYWVWAIAAGAVCLLNPYGFDGALFPLTQLGEIQTSSPFKSATVGIAEFRSPFQIADYSLNGSVVLLQPLFFMQLYALLALAALAALAGLGRRMRGSELLSFVLFGYVFWQAQKNWGYFVVATLPMVATGLDELGSSIRRRVAPLGPLRFDRALAGFTLVLAALFGAQLASGWLYAQERLPHRFGHRLNEQLLPVRACRFLAASVPPGRMLNTLGDGGLVSWLTARPVFADGRTEVMGEQLFVDYSRLRESRELERALERWRIDTALVPLNFRPEWSDYFRSSSDWRVVYADEQHQIFVKRDFAPELPTHVFEERSPALALRDAARLTAILENTLPQHEPRLWETITKHHYYPMRELRHTLLYMSSGRPDLAVEAGLSALERSTIPSDELLHNLSVALLSVGDREHAAACYDAISPDRRRPELGELLAP